MGSRLMWPTAAGPAATTTTAGRIGGVVAVGEATVYSADWCDCLCPDGYPQYEEVRPWIRVVKHTGQCERADSLQVHDKGEWITVWGK